MANFYIFHLNDQALQIKDSKNVLESSPGVACLSKNKIVTGIEAIPLLSKHPSLASSQHWHRVNKTQSSILSNCKATNADLVHSHLIKMWSQLPKDRPVIIIYPSEYTEEKLGTICGIFNALGLHIIGLINSDLSSLAETGFFGTLRLVRIQLNYTAQVMIDSKETVFLRSATCRENYGLIQLNDLLVRSIQKIFVRQCRADPLINGESEHYMRVQIAHWLKQSNQKKKFFADTLINGNPYRAEINSETILSVCRDFFKDIINDDKYENDRLILCPSIFSLTNNIWPEKKVFKLPCPKLDNFIESLTFEKKEEVVVNFKNNFPNHSFTERANGHANNDANPTHILKDNQGHKLSESPIIFKNGKSNILIFKRDEKIFLEPNGSFVFINDSPKKKEVQLVVGDSIKFGDNSEPLKAISIEG